MKLPLRVGLTGGIGSGKSTICDLFSQLNVPIIDADLIAKEIVEPGTEGLQKVVSIFGKDILNKQGSLDRKKLREIIFNNDSNLKQLNSILHPLVYQSIELQSQSIVAPYCVIAIPLLFETNGEQFVDRVLFIDSPIELQIQRTIERDSVPRSQVENIIRSQMSRENKLTLADDIIDNSSSINHIKQEVLRLDRFYRGLCKTNS